jgi:GT2 family glycosyltransferase/glycosyltransferase involved in cell wall biosynthesis
MKAELIDEKTVVVSAPQAPNGAEWEYVAEMWKSPAEEPAVDVIVPVYRGFDETLRCLYNVLVAPQVTPYRLVVVDDHSPEPELRDALRRLAARGWIELHTTPENVGFVGACNLAMQLHPRRDVLLLNSDAEVHNNWLDRLRTAALRTPRTGTVTPFSNNATICSYPRFVVDNTRALEISDTELDLLAASINAGAEVEIPTGVGFCMYIRRACLDDVGLFDQESFGRGYGEENDLCRRAAAAGWRNILAGDVFVRHHGATSFGADKVDRVSKALQTIEYLHPGYHDLVSRFVSEDSPRGLRVALDMARLARRARGRGAILFVMHNWGGGTERHAQELAGLLEADDVPVFWCRAASDEPGRIRVSDSTIIETPNLPSFDVARDLGLFADALNRMCVSHIHVHHLAGLPESTSDFIRLSCLMANVTYDVTLHDYIAICPHITLTDDNGVYCGEPDLATCESCVTRGTTPFGRPSVWEWRDRYARLLTSARRVFVPDADVGHRMGRYFPDITFCVYPHPEVGTLESSTAAGILGRRPQQGIIRRIALIGAIGPHKGSQLLLDCAREALQKKLPLEFVVLGYTDRDAEFATMPNVSVVGRYAEEDLQKYLAELNADVAWFPAVWPETYSYTLSAALAARLFPVAFDFGAIASRVRKVGWGELMPIEWMLYPDRLVDRLAHMPLPPPPDRELLSVQTYPDVLASYYELSCER